MDPGIPAWQPMLGALLDDRAAMVDFLFPRPPGDIAGFVRVRVGASAILPPVELTDPSLVTVTFAGSTPDEGTKIDNLEMLGALGDSLEHLPAVERRARVVARALTLPGVTHAGVSPLTTNVWIRYADGDHSLLIADRTPPPGGVIELPEPESEPIQLRMPASLDAVCGFSVDFFMPDSTKLVNSWLRKAGYQSIVTNVVTVDKLLSWKNLGVFFWQAHCGTVPVDPEQPEGPQIMTIMTQQPASVELSQGRFKALRDSGAVVIVRPEKKSAWPPGVMPPPFYGVSSKFVSEHMRFADRSFVVIDACSAGLPEMANAFLKANAGAYISWNQPVCHESGTPLRQLFDRLLGMNSEAPFSSPKERPFCIQMVQHWMQEKRLDFDPSPCGGFNGQLQWYFAANTGTGAKKAPRTLLPTIYRVLHESGDQGYPFTKFLIEGDFDKDFDPSQRVVTWGNQVLPVHGWEENAIRVKLPAPPYPVGDIQVIMGNRRSNAVPMTEWSVPFTYTLNGEGSLQYVIELNVKLRGDARGFREFPQGPVRSTPPLPMWQLADCTGTLGASGTYKPDPDTTVTWSGGGSLKSEDSPFGAILASAGVSYVNASLENCSLTAQGTFTQTTNGESSVVDGRIDGFLGFIFPPWNLKFDATTFTIPPGSMRAVFPLWVEHGVSAELRWSAAPAQAVPTNDTPR